MKVKYFHLLVLSILSTGVMAQPWEPDLGNGRYKNPIIFADYSDPDILRAGDDFYMVASSFNCMPGIPILHSTDLVNWEIVNHVYDRLPLEKYNKPVHGEGSWAPSIRFHQGKYFVYFCTPYDGLFMATADHPSGNWELNHIIIKKTEEYPIELFSAYIGMKCNFPEITFPKRSVLLSFGFLVKRNFDFFFLS